MKFLNPEDTLREFGVYGTQHVADIGSGAGHFALAAAKRLEGGRLYAIDLEQELLKRLADEAHHLGFSNVQTLWGDASQISGVPLAGASVDRVIAANVLWAAHDRDALVQEVKRLLRPGGKVLLLEWREDMPGGPGQAHKVPVAHALALFERHGFRKERDVDAGDMHYGMIIVRA